MATVQPRLPPTTCFRIIMPGLTSLDPGQQKREFHFLLHNGLRGKKATDEQRAHFALDLLCDFIKGVELDAESRAAIIDGRKQILRGRESLLSTPDPFPYP